MLLAGDEFKRTQNGNNNAYCQDNPISWINWEYAEKNRAFMDFVKGLIQFRKDHPVFRRGHFFQGKDLNNNGLHDIKWMDENLNQPDWNNIKVHSIAFSLDGTVIDTPDNDFFVVFNAGNKDIRQRIPGRPENKSWYQAINTSLDNVDSIASAGHEPLISSDRILIKPKTSIVLLSR